MLDAPAGCVYRGGMPSPCRRLPAICATLALLVAAAPAGAADWIEVGADTEARYYVDVDSIEVRGENVRVMKKGVYTHVLTDNFAGRKASFKESRGVIELDCRRRINRIVEIEMIGEDGSVVWASGPMPKRAWEEVRTNSHAESTMDLVCARAPNA